MKNMITICRIDETIEEEVEFTVNNQKLIAFNTSMQELVVGNSYEAEIDMFLIDGLDMEEQIETKQKKMEHVENFSYFVHGKLLNLNVLDAGCLITSDLFEDYQYLVGKYVTLKIDRLQISVD